jgi:excisionase family DNA binding protein
MAKAKQHNLEPGIMRVRRIGSRMIPTTVPVQSQRAEHDAQWDAEVERLAHPEREHPVVREHAQATPSALFDAWPKRQRAWAMQFAAEEFAMCEDSIAAMRERKADWDLDQNNHGAEFDLATLVQEVEMVGITEAQLIERSKYTPGFGERAADIVRGLAREFADAKLKEEIFTRHWRQFEKATGYVVFAPVIDVTKPKPVRSERELVLTPTQIASSHLDIATRIERWGRGLTVAELALLLPISEPQLYAMIERHEIPSYRIRGSICLDPVLTARWLRTQAA